MILIFLYHVKIMATKIVYLFQNKSAHLKFDITGKQFTNKTTCGYNAFYHRTKPELSLLIDYNRKQ